MADTQNTSSGAIGYVRVVEGHVTATAADGSFRVLHVGDLVYADEQIETGPGGGVVIELRDGNDLVLGPASEGVLDREVYDVETAQALEDQTSTIEALQQAILAGADPTKILEAPAAGEGAGGELSDSDQGADLIERTGEHMTPESGFETTGIDFALENALEDEGDFIPTTAADVTFAISSTPSISEDAEDTAFFTVTLGGDPLVGSNTASVQISVGGSALSGVDYSNFEDALTSAAASTPGVTYSGGVLTFDSSFSGPDFSF
jgi:hypothetical protein